MMDKTKKVRYVFSVFMVMLMVGIAEWTGEKEIIFPEMAALAVGLWVIDKRVWKVGRWQLIGLMTAGAVAGVCIVRSKRTTDRTLPSVRSTILVTGTAPAHGR